MRRRPAALLLGLGVVLGGGVPGLARAQPFYPVQLTTDGSTKFRATASGPRYAWAEADRVRFWNGTLIRSVDSPGIPFELGIAGSHLAWATDDGDTWSVHYSDGGAAVTLASGIDRNPQPAVSAAGTVAWEERISGTLTEIWFWDGSSASVARNGVKPDRHLAFRGTDLVYRNPGGGTIPSLDEEIWLWDGSSHTVITQNDFDDGEPVASASGIAWKGFTGALATQSDIYFWDGSSITQVTSNPLYRPELVIAQTRLVWTQGSSVFTWNGAGVVQIDGGLGGAAVDVDAAPSEVIWSRHEGDYHLMYWDGSQTQQITGVAADDRQAHFAGNEILWVRNAGAFQVDVFRGVRTPPPVFLPSLSPGGIGLLALAILAAGWLWVRRAMRGLETPRRL